MTSTQHVAVWKCGHPLTPENSKHIRNNTGIACLICFRAIDAKYQRGRRARERNEEQSA